ncbi:MAG: enoyl-CoA hydratase [Thalassobium sp.]|uniref:crotonase/enoyl-CoA hydratase family protein n=1 Tax=Thalassolituus oleivorans TaxID=187493 RepID=UPI000C0CF172|nr:crotonase/enoyl-CoA hydratase family protein [Thalassolituus oleivorans]PHQ83315.1 MAG: enoyl-CoA hydratase [Thalassobium sp.]PHQ87194.1 MAG: enoyl-CoA hydratase [Thalassobium sp.]
MSYNTLSYDITDSILTITLNRPEQLNAFTVEMCEELIRAFDSASTDDEVRAIIVTGAGRAFCAGMDLSREGNVFGLDESIQPTLEDMTSRYNDTDIVAGVRDTGGRVALSIFRCTKPVIAAINGAAVGIGATMTCAMDIRIATEHTRIGFIFSKVGVVPEACSSWFLPRIVGISRALEWTMTGDIFDGAEALEGGFVRAVVPADKLLDEARKIAKRISTRSAVSVAMIRQMMYRNSALDNPEDAHRIESLGMYYTSLVDGKEGVASFLEKRPSNFTAKVSDGMPPFYPWWEKKSN